VGWRLRQLHTAEVSPPEVLNLTHPDHVRRVHESYQAAGAQLHRTNTRNANGPGLAASGHADRCEAANNIASALLREVVGPEAPVMGVIGQIPPTLDGRPVPLAEREQAYSEQVVYLSDTGATLLGLEHFTHLEEALLLLRIAKSASDAPVLAQLQFDQRGLTAEGLSCSEAARRLVDGGAGALGISCGPAPEMLPPLVEALLAQGLPVSVMPGLAHGEAGAPYAGAPAWSAETFAAELSALAQMGVAVVGGCCGVTPEHIQALAQRLDGRDGGRADGA
jgi:homocysteine S-methyltransferase